MALDVEQAISIMQSHNMIRPVNITNGWYRCYCPIHSGGQERKPSFGISLSDQYRGGELYPAGFAHCFACGYAKPLPELIEDILKDKGVSQTGEEWLIENLPGYDPEPDFDYLVPESMIAALQSKYAVKQIQDMTSQTPKYVSEEELATYRYVVPYMYERKLTDEIIEKYDIGYDANWIPPGRKKPVPCITIPVRDINKNTLFLCRRSIAGKLFNYPEGVVKPVYGVDMIPAGTKSVIICESCLDALAAVSYGYPAVALLGTGNRYQIQQLKQLGCREFVICTDGDEAGRRAASKLKRYLKSVALVWVVPMPDGKDVNDLSKEEFDDVYARRE